MDANARTILAAMWRKKMEAMNESARTMTTKGSLGVSCTLDIIARASQRHLHLETSLARVGVELHHGRA